MAFDNTKLSYFHSFSKTPVQDSTSLGNAINKSGHTVTASEVWSQDIPYYGKMGSLVDVTAKVQPYARKNDMCYITAGADKGKTFQYDGEGNWTDITATLVDGALIKNSKDEVVLLYHKGQNLTNLTADNNANTDSANNAARLWASRAKDGSALPVGETRLIEQFVAPTDKALNGLASVAYAPVIANGSLVSGTGYYDYCFSGTILWATARTAVTPIDCFEYVGGKVSDVADTVASHTSTIAIHTSEISELKEKLGIEDDDNPDSPSTPTLGGRVTALEEAVETLNGDATTEGSIAKSIQDAIDSLGDVAEKSDIKIADIIVQIGDGEATSLTPDENKSVTITIPEVQAATTDVAGVVTISDNNAIATTETTSTAAATVAAVAATRSEIAAEIGALTGTVSSNKTEVDGKISAIEGKLASTGEIGKAIADVKTTADAAVQSVTRADGSSDLITVIDGTDVTISLSTEVATKTDAATAASTAITTSLAGTTDGTIGKAISDVATTANSAVQSVTLGSTIPDGVSLGDDAKNRVLTIGTSQWIEEPDGPVDGKGFNASGSRLITGQTALSVAQSVANDLEKKLTTGEGSLGTRVTNLESSVSEITTTTIPNAITTAKTETLGTTITTATGKDDETAPKVTVQLSGTVQTPSLTVTTADIASAQALAALETKVDNFHKAGVSYQVLQSLPTASSTYNGVVVLVPASTDDDPTAVAGDYVEHLCVNKGTEESPVWDWERIGTTKADLTQYAKTADLNVTETTANGLTYSQTNGVVSASVAKASTSQVGTVQLTDTYTATDDTNAATGKSIAAAIATLDATNVGEGAVKVSQADGIVTSVSVATEGLVSENAIKDTTDSETALITAKDALAAIKLAKPENYVASVTGYTTTGTEETTQGEVAVKVLDGRGTSVTASDLWGTTVTMDASGVITVDHKFLTNPNGNSAWLENVKAVQDNKAYSEITTDGEGNFSGVVEDSVLANIQTEMIKDGSYMFYNTSLTSFSGDLSSLVNGNRMFYTTSLTSFNGDSSGSPVNLSSLVNGSNMFAYTSSLTSFSGDSSGSPVNLSSLVNGTRMFYNTSLTSFSGDLSSLVSGNAMFYGTSLTSFSNDLSSLVDGSNMFAYTSSLTSFSGDLSSLVDGSSMFDNSSLTSFSGDLSSLVNGSRMFYATSLDTESVECIADTIRNVTDLSDSSITGSDGETYRVNKRIDIGIANSTPNEAENAAFWTMVNEKGWSVYVNKSEYNPTKPTAIATLDENGEEVTTPIPFWAKPVETDEEHAEYVGEDGKFYNVVGAQFIYVSDPETYGQFTSLEDAVANMRLTKIENKA